jgi:hypothetical protein
MKQSIIDSIPNNGIDFGYVGVQQTSQKSFSLFNPSPQIIKFEII